MRAAIIENGVVVNVTVADEAFAQAQGWVLSDTAQIGWSYDGSTFTPPPPPAPAVPASVGPVQARLALHQVGRLAEVEALMADPGTDPMTKMAWEKATEFKRTSPTIAALAGALSLTAQDLDELFILAAGLDA